MIHIYIYRFSNHTTKNRIEFFRCCELLSHLIGLTIEISGEQSISLELRAFFDTGFCLVVGGCAGADENQFISFFFLKFYFQEEKRQAKEEKKRGKNVKYFSLLCDNKTDSKSKK